jgi:hypothetical protein
VPFTAIAHRLLRMRPRRGGGLSSYFAGDVSAVEALAADIMAAAGVTGRAGHMAAIETAVDVLSAIGGLDIVGGLTAPGVVGSFAPDALIEILPLSGESFGSVNFNHVLFDDFRGQADGAKPSTTAVVGTWSSTAGEVDTAYSVLDTGRSWRHPGNNFILRKSFTPARGFRCSFWLRSASLSDGQIQGGRSKTAWVMDTASGYLIDGRLDLAFPTKANNTPGGWVISGNDGNLASLGTPWLPAQEWVRMMFGFDDTYGWRVVRVGETYGVQVHQSSNNPYALFPNSTTVSNVDFGSTTDPEYNYGPIQIHTADVGVMAAVEIGDAATYGACTKLFDCDIVSWNGTIRARVRAPSALLASRTARLFITLPNRTVLSGRLIS